MSDERLGVVLLVRLDTDQPEALVAAIAAHGVYVALGKTQVAKDVEVTHVSAEIDGQAQVIEYEMEDDDDEDY